MRDQGRLVEWFDEKGYGFIQPNDVHKDRVFLHIKDFARTGPRQLSAVLWNTRLFSMSAVVIALSKSLI